MTGGTLYMYENPGYKINREYIGEATFTKADYIQLESILKDYVQETGSKKAEYIVSDWEEAKSRFRKFIPLSMITIGEDAENQTESSEQEGNEQ